MARTSTIPAQIVNEDIRSIQEFPPSGTVQPGTIISIHTRGIVQVQTGVKDADGNWKTPQQHSVYAIEGDDYDELVGPPQAWNPNKPEGTYHNEDLWHFIDKQRAAASVKVQE
jgi:hypothetical protein